MKVSEPASKRQKFANPFKPGAGHMPPYLAGRESEEKEFRRLLAQTTILENLVLTGLRGLGKTVLLERFKPTAIQEGWLWAGTDLSESMSISEESLATRLLTDLSVVTSSITHSIRNEPKFGLTDETQQITATLDFATLVGRYNGTPGLVADKLKSALEFVWSILQMHGKRGVIFAYDEAQNLSDHAAKDQFPLSLLLDIFQSIQRKNIPFMLVLTGLPTLFPKLVEARTFAERMFRVIFLDPLNEQETSEAVLRPIKNNNCPVHFSPESVQTIWGVTRGYPYFVQYVCREAYDVWVQNAEAGQSMSPIPVREIVAKLDSDFFAGRWARATDRQRELMSAVASLPNCESEFTVQELIESDANRALAKPFSSSHANQMLATLTEAGLIYKNRHGKYSFAVPLLGGFIRRQRAYLEGGFAQLE
ncbi:ATP-binding protein [Steroidobacter agaridevorans]|uniref:ATP-binding protein n=1 Tax=Steroidobacter agaridevorans TaxID=2695856 RepID=UPI001322E7CA|nr:ATP-binding protein [Steroidobacter agaridevorans]GFE87307.1 ATPase [Steroidobacter agaridevorans]